MKGEEGRFIIGIDLGTTNCAVSYFDKNEKNQIFRIPQFNGQKMVEALPLLPSFYYVAEEEELINCCLPWEKESKSYAVGTFAEKEGLRVPTKLVSSAKSWLSNKNCDRKEKILPFDAFDSHKKISPVEATSSFLEHIRKAWDHQFAKSNSSFELQESHVVITVPASFDEVARELTIDAAKSAGFHNFTLLEEPQAAFYSWLMDHEKDYRDYFEPGDFILVCDVGGGTSDFSLIQVTKTGENLEFQRMAVGPHLLLGGDNMDLALCHYVEKSKKEELTNEQWTHLRYSAKQAKEFLLGTEEKTYSLWVPGKGSRVVGGGFGVQLKSEEIKNLLSEGFFGLHSFEEAIQLNQGSAIRGMGLNFESDPSITKHLAHFLHKSGIQKKPRYLLFNGGSLKPQIFQKRIAQSLDTWFKEERKVEILKSYSLDLAVARGAAYFGRVRLGEGIRIGGGIPRAFYLKMQEERGSQKALTLCERGTKEGTEYVLNSNFLLTANAPVSFQILHSHTRLNDKKEELVEINEEEMSFLPPLFTVLKYGKEKEASLAVNLQLKLTELGTLEISLISKETNHVWKLEFQFRSADKGEFTQRREVDEVISEELLVLAKKEIQEAFAVGSQEKLKGIIASLEKILQKPKNEWSFTTLRSLYEALSEAAAKKSLSSLYESRFWNLAGFFLRPGMGFPLDDYRMKEIWKWILSDLKITKVADVEIQKSIFYRRISAGLKKGQQLQIVNELLPSVYNPKRKIFVNQEKKERYAFEEALRALSSMEFMDISLKQNLGEALLERILTSKGGPAEYWSLGRIGARHLLYGGVQNVLPKSVCQDWVERLLGTPTAENDHLPFLLFMLSKKTDFREINLSETYRDKVAAYLKEKGDDLNTEEHFSLKQQEKMFGDSLPQGLRLT